MSKLRHRFRHVVVLSVLALGVTAVPVATPLGDMFGPSTASAACNGFTVYSDADKGGYQWSTCADDSDLRDNQATKIGWCAFLNTSWNDCISSVAANFTGNTQVCLWSDINFSGNGLKVPPGAVGWWNMPGWLNDAISSIEFATQDCFAGGNQS